MINIEKKHVLVVFALTFMVFRVSLLSPLFFTVGPDELRHLLMIQRFVDGEEIIFQPDTAYEFYPPGFHVLVAAASIISSLAPGDVMVAVSAFMSMLFALFSYLTAKIIMREKATYFFVFSLILFPPLGPKPTNLIYFVLMPALIYSTLKYISGGSRRDMLVFLVSGLLTSISHFAVSGLMLILFTTSTVVACLFFLRELSVKQRILDLWFLSCFFPLVGFLIYHSLMEKRGIFSVNQSSDFYFSLALWEKVRVFLNQNVFLITFFCGFMLVILYFSAKTVLTKSLKRERIRYPKIILVAGSSITLVVLLFNVILSLLTLILSHFFNPPFSRSFRFFIFDLASLKLPQFGSLIQPASNLTLLLFFFMLSLILIYRNLKSGVNFSGVVIFSGSLLLLCLSLILAYLLFFVSRDFLLFRRFNSRAIYYLALPVFVVGFTQMLYLMKLNKPVKQIVLLLLLLIVVFSTTNHFFMYASSRIHNSAFQWVFASTIIKPDEKLVKEGYENFDKYGYYHINKFDEVSRKKCVAYIGKPCVYLSNRDDRWYLAFSLGDDGNKVVYPFLSLHRNTVFKFHEEDDDLVYSNPEVDWYKQVNKTISILNYTITSAELREEIKKQKISFGLE